MLRSLINSEEPTLGTSFMCPVGAPVSPVGAAPPSTRKGAVYGLLSEEGGLAAYDDRLKQERLRRKGSGKARV